MSPIRLLPASLALWAATGLSALACSLPPDAAAMRAEVLAGVNAERARAGMPALDLQAGLGKAAQGHACDSATRDRMGHTSSDGSKLTDRVKRQGYRMRLAAENVGTGFDSGTNAVDWWMSSAGHRQNILLRDARDIGIGVARAPGSNRLHWVMVVAKPR